MLLFYLGWLPVNLSNSFPPLQESSSSTCLRIPIGAANEDSHLFIWVQWQISKVKPKHKIFLWRRCSGDRGLKWKSDHCLKRRKGIKKKHTHTQNLTQRIVTHLKISPCSLNVLLRALKVQSTGNARICYILIRAHKALSRMLCGPGECTEQGTFTNSRSVSPLHHCEKKEIYEVQLYGCYILELLAHSQMRMLAEIARFPERNF